MNRSNVLAVALLAGLLGACEQSDTAKALDSPGLEAQEPAAEPEAPALVAEVIAAEKPDRRRQPAPIAQRPVPEAELDLSLPEEVVEQLEPLEPLPDTPLLPEFFDNRMADNDPFKLHGRLLVDEFGEQDLGGAELRFEFKR